MNIETRIEQLFLETLIPQDEIANTVKNEYKITEEKAYSLVYNVGMELGDRIPQGTEEKATSKEAIEKAVKAATEAEQDIEKQYQTIQSMKLENSERIKAIKNVDKSGRVQQAGRVTVTATSGGNSKRKHIRLSFKIDGKRASRKAVEEMFYQ